MGKKARLLLIRTVRVVATLAVALLASHCGSSTPSPAPNSIVISNFQYFPSNLVVSAGTSISITNQDSMAHTITSESVMNAYTPGAVNGVQFDTGSIASSTSLAIPSNAPAGTVIPYFCSVHLSTMPQGQITIAAN